MHDLLSLRALLTARPLRAGRVVNPLTLDRALYDAAAHHGSTDFDVIEMAWRLSWCFGAPWSRRCWPAVAFDRCPDDGTDWYVLDLLGDATGTDRHELARRLDPDADPDQPVGDSRGQTWRPHDPLARWWGRSASGSHLWAVRPDGAAVVVAVRHVTRAAVVVLGAWAYAPRSYGDRLPVRRSGPPDPLNRWRWWHALGDQPISAWTCAVPASGRGIAALAGDDPTNPQAPIQYDRLALDDGTVYAATVSDLDRVVPLPVMARAFVDAEHVEARARDRIRALAEREAELEATAAPTTTPTEDAP